MQHNQRDGALLIVLCVVGYSFVPIFSKLLYPLGMEPLDIAFWRFAFTNIIFWGLVFVRQRRGAPPPAKPLPRVGLLLLGMLFAGEALAAFIGFQYLPAATFSVLFYSYPAIVAILETFRGERLAPIAWLALALTLVGIALTAPDFSAGLTGNNFLGVAMALGDAFMVAIYFMITSRVLRGHTDLVRTSAWMVTGAFGLLIVVGLVHGLKPPPPEAWLYLIGLAIVSTVVPTFALNAGIQRLGSTRAAIIATFEPAFTAVLAFVTLGETLQDIQLLGGAIIIASVILLQLRRPTTENAEQAALARE